jgi:TonB family protein
MTQPSVILPAGLYRSAGDGELRAILMHELAHIHHSDHVLGLLQRTVKALYWWNPLVYRACDTLTAAREEVSDNYAIAAMGSASSYATLLVRLLEEAPRIRRMPCVAGMAAPHECLQTRIWNIVSRNRDLRVKAGKGAISAISAAALLLCGLVGIGSQVKIFGTGQAAASEKDRPIEAGTSQAGMNVPSPPGAAPAIEAPRRSTHSHVETVQRTVPAIAPTGRTAVQFTRRTNLARSDSFPTVRNEETDAPRTTPVPLDESTQPVVRSRVEPALTPVASRARITATVTVAVIVNEKGEVYEARVRKGHPLLDRSALSAVLQWKFEPMVVDGAPRAFVATIDLYFHP